MKKTKWFVLATSLLLAAAFALAGCAGVGKLYDDKYVAPSVTKTDLTALDGYALPGSTGSGAIDAFGLFMAYKADTEGATTYVLYNAETNSVVAQTTEAGGFAKIADGLYRVTLLPDAAEGETSYQFYGKSGLVYTAAEDAGTYRDGVLAFRDGTILVVGIDGTVTQSSYGFDPVFAPAACAKRGDVYVENVAGSVYRVWKENGKLARTVNVDEELGLPSAAALMASFDAGSSMVNQYIVLLPDDASRYDLIYYMEEGGSVSAVKCDLITKRYDFASGKVSEYNFDFLIEDAYSLTYTDEAVIVYGNPIEDRQLVDKATLRIIGANCKDVVDVQGILPGATDIEESGPYIVVTDGASRAVFENGKHLATVDASVQFAGGFFYRQIGSNCVYYDAEGNKVLEGTTNGGDAGDKVLMSSSPANGILYYSVTGEGETPVTNIYSYTLEGGEKLLGEAAYGSGFVGFVFVKGSSADAYTVYLQGFEEAILSNVAVDGMDIDFAASGISEAAEARYTILQYKVKNGEELVDKYLLLRLTGSDYAA